MDIKFANMIVESDESGTMELRESYSGRGMYGAETAGVVFESYGELMSAVAIAAIDCFETPSSERDSFVRAMRRLSFDSMGIGRYIVY